MSASDTHGETEPFTGNELDESWDEPESPQNETETGISVGYRQPTFRKKGLRAIPVIVCFAAGICLSAIVYGILPGTVGKQQIRSPRVYRYVISETQEPPVPSLQFGAFIIPLHKSKVYSYLSIGMAFDLQKESLRREMIEKKHTLRGVIYDTLMKETNRSGTIPSPETIKAFIVRRVNAVLTAGRINGVYINQYLSV